MTLAPLDGSWLVDFGFRLPGVLIGHQLPAANESLAACGALPSRPSDPAVLDAVTDRRLWAERFSRTGGNQLGVPLEKPEGTYHLAQDRDEN